jgi:hypothetical protein
MMTSTDLGELRLQSPRSEVATLVAGKYIPLSEASQTLRPAQLAASPCNPRCM